jgi:probable blue pigment (indigoidine) exporter
MLVAAALLGPLAIAVEGRPPAIGRSGIAALAYVGPVATAFAYWAVVDMGRRFRANTISMALLATPSLGSLLSALTLGERVDGTLVVGIALVGTGIRLATMTRSALPAPARGGLVRRGAEGA